MDDLISRQAALDITPKAKADRDYRTNNLDDAYEDGFDDALNALAEIPSAEGRGRWTIEAVHQYELAYGATAYEPVYKCSCCGCLTESYLRLDEPIMPDDADFPKWCPNCGASMMDEVSE